MRKPEQPNVPGVTDFEKFDNAVRRIVAVSKDELLRREKMWKRERMRKKHRK